MAKRAEWDERFNRTGFYEVHKRKDGFNFSQPAAVCLVTIAGTNFGAMIEPVDAYTQGGMAPGVGTTGIQTDWGKFDQCVELGSKLNNILEDRKTGEAKPTPLHAPGFGWPR